MRITISFLILHLVISTTFAEAQGKAASTEKAGTAKDAAEQAAAARRLDLMKSAAKAYDIVLGPDFKSKLVLEPEPALRFTNPVSGLQDGGFVLWKSDQGRPMVGAQLFLTRDDLWIHEFQSLATVPLRMTRAGKTIWEPRKAGVEVKLVPEAPKPAASSALRLTQMREIARRFAASDAFEGRPKTDELRLLASPLIRFGADNSATLDGALFTHAHGTDPELLIVIEALKSGDQYQWYYSLAPMTGYALKASLDDKPVWEVPWRQGPFDPKETFFLQVQAKDSSAGGARK